MVCAYLFWTGPKLLHTWTLNRAWARSLLGKTAQGLGCCCCKSGGGKPSRGLSDSNCLKNQVSDPCKEFQPQSMLVYTRHASLSCLYRFTSRLLPGAFPAHFPPPYACSLWPIIVREHLVPGTSESHFSINAKNLSWTGTGSPETWRGPPGASPLQPLLFL